jgi:hypothetical protein
LSAIICFFNLISSQSFSCLSCSATAAASAATLAAKSFALSSTGERSAEDASIGPLCAV